ncbi:hydrogenase maturation nickel metallochaperone HypA/HybF [Tepidibacillus decaturensis]|uniref:Hydrogenase maturation factor HypA n=1 Tax=Tepidibacillus decaturensis TaxID=1413211 RepID=A0A135L6K5_9BACI|nr:hydrogenase maturation nickel metallochaperone HypA [Tepidibacillus decaturensis]KXG44443.1 hydrogenase nickel incorporation protein HypA [Tepidibacillus decaturensis]
MHEMALMGDILHLIEEDAKKRNIKKVEEVDLIVGELSNALPDALEMAFDVYKSQGIDFLDKNAKLTIIHEKAKAICVICELEYMPEQRIAVCPACNFPSGKLIAGETFKVKSYKGN